MWMFYLNVEQSLRHHTRQPCTRSELWGQLNIQFWFCNNRSNNFHEERFMRTNLRPGTDYLKIPAQNQFKSWNSPHQLARAPGTFSPRLACRKYICRLSLWSLRWCRLWYWKTRQEEKCLSKVKTSQLRLSSPFPTHRRYRQPGPPGRNIDILLFSSLWLSLVQSWPKL